MAGLWDFITGVANNYNPAAFVGDAVANYRSLFGSRVVDGQVVPGEVDREAQPLTSEWFAKRAGVQAEDNPAYNAGQFLPGPGALKSGLLGAGMVMGRGAKGLPKLGSPGWYKGPDMMPRYEISDQASNLMKPVTREGGGKLYDVLDHEDLYKAYPELKNIPVIPMRKEEADQMFKANGDGKHAGDPLLEGYRYGAGIHPQGKYIQINPNLSPASQRASLLHEIQHWIQKREGMAGGVSNIRAATAASAMYQAWNAVPSGMLKQQMQKEAKAMGLSIDNPAKLKEQLYKRAHGEVEARATANRANMSEDARDITPINIDYDVQPILWEQISKKLFGRNVLDETVDITTNGTRGMSERAMDAQVRKALGL